MPAKGRLRDPYFHLLEDACIGPEQPGDRALAFPCRNAPVEVLLVISSSVKRPTKAYSDDVFKTGRRVDTFCNRYSIG